jgi:hypothetical protein
MRGYPRYNFDAFEAAALDLESRGIKIISPHRMDLEIGFDPAGSLDGFDLHGAIRRDIEAIISTEACIFLPGWDKSTGARAEKAISEWAGHPCLNYPDLSSMDSNLVTFNTGAVRDVNVAGSKSSKFPARYDLISPIGLKRLAETYGEGSLKYTDHNWRNGMPFSSTLNHAIAHLYEFLKGDKSEDHLAHAAWGLFSIMHFEETFPEGNDLKADDYEAN